MKKKLAVVVGAFSAVYMFVPDPTDVIPILGWLDEGVAGAMLLWSLKTLEVTPGAILARLRGEPKSAPARPARDADDDLGDVLDAGLNARLNRLKQTA